MRLTHWLNAVFLAGMIGSGLQIYTAYAHFGYHGDTFGVPNPFDASRAATSARSCCWAAGSPADLRWHFTLAWPFVLTGAGVRALPGHFRRMARAALPAARHCPARGR